MLRWLLLVVAFSCLLSLSKAVNEVQLKNIRILVHSPSSILFQTCLSVKLEHSFDGGISWSKRGDLSLMLTMGGKYKDLGCFLYIIARIPYRQ